MSSVIPFSSCLQSSPASGASALPIRWPKYWSFSFSINPFNEYSGLISFRMDWLDLLAVQGTLKSLLQHHSSKVSILQCSAFFMFQLSYSYRTTGKNHSFGYIDPLLAKCCLCFLIHCLGLSQLFFQGESVFYLFIFSFIFISWRLITLQYCSGFCHTLI